MASEYFLLLEVSIATGFDLADYRLLEVLSILGELGVSGQAPASGSVRVAMVRARST